VAVLYANPENDGTWSPENEKNKIVVFALVYDGTINDSRVRLRTEPNLNSATLEYLNTGDTVKIIDRSEEKQKIDDMDAYWFQVETEDNETGWVYGWFVDVEGSHQEDKVEQSDAHEFEIAQEEQIDVVIADEGSTKTLEAEELARVDIASSKKNSILPKALWFLGIVVFLSVLFIVWERRKRD